MRDTFVMLLLRGNPAGFWTMSLEASESQASCYEILKKPTVDALNASQSFYGKHRNGRCSLRKRMYAALSSFCQWYSSRS